LNSRRTLILIAAIAVGALAAFAIFNYVGGIEDRANENARRVPVIRIAQDIPRGLTAQEARDQGYLDLGAEIAAEFLPATAVTDIETITTKVAVADLATGQVLVENMFVDPINAQVTASRRIETGNVAVSVSVDNIRGVAGLIVPGDYVNMMAIPSGSSCEAGTEADAAAAEAPAATPTDPAVFCSPARMVYQGVQVLFVDRSPVPLPGEQTAADGAAAPANNGLLTLSVPPAAAQVIASVGSDQWYLTLLPVDYTPAPVPAFNASAPTLPGEDAARLTPYGPGGFQPGEAP
jgi:pilus assembly protein CpaB